MTQHIDQSVDEPERMTDAKTVGDELEQIQVGVPHASPRMTETYIKRRLTPVSEVFLSLPGGEK